MGEQDQDTVIISVRRARRGVVVQVVGSDEKFQCSEARSIGEAILDILEDPSTPRAEFDEMKTERFPRSERMSRSAGRTGLAKRDTFRPEPEPEDQGREVMIGGRRTNTKDLQEALMGEMDLADQMAYQAASSVWGGLQKVSNWRRSGGKKKKKKKG